MPNLTTLRIGIQNTTSFISSSVTTLSLLFTPDLFLQDRKAMSRVIKHIRMNLPNVRTLTISGGERVARYTHYIIRMLAGFKRIQHITLCPSAYTLPVFKALSRIPTLETISVLEYDKVFSRSKFKRSESTLGKPGDTATLVHGAFHALKALDITVEACEDLSLLLQNPSFPSSQLTTLWSRFSSGPTQTPLSISFVIETVATCCTMLQRLTLRFGPFQHVTVSLTEQTEPISLRHILPIFDLSSLTELALDHSLPIPLTNTDIDILAEKARYMKVLWLNPFPITKSSKYGEIRIPDITILDHLAVRCRHLERLGILVDTTTASTREPPRARFANLRELFLGCSELADAPKAPAARPLLWEDISIYLSAVLSPFTEFTTSREYNSFDLISSPPSSSYMRPAFISIHDENLRMGSSICSWIAVFGMRRWLQSNLSSYYTYPTA